MDDEFDKNLIAAEVLGRKAKLFLEKSEILSTRIHQVIADNLRQSSNSQISRDWARKLDRDIEYSLSILKAFEKGLNWKNYQ